MQQGCRIAVITNPTAGSGAGGRALRQVRPLFDTAMFAGCEVGFFETRSKDHAVELGRDLSHDLLVSISGDGTLHDIVQGMMARHPEQRPVLSVIPVGSGNDFSHTLGISDQPLQAVSDLSDARVKVIDVGLCNDTYFLETLSFGVDAKVAINTHELRKTTRSRGAVLYTHAAVLAILSDLKPRMAHYTIDGEQFANELLIMAVQNGPTYGGGFKIAPQALIDDGLLNIALATKVSVPRAFYYLACIKNGTHEGLKHVQTYKARQLSIEFETPPAAQCDGEDIGENTTYDIEVVPGALKIMVPLKGAVKSYCPSASQQCTPRPSSRA